VSVFIVAFFVQFLLLSGLDPLHFLFNAAYWIAVSGVAALLLSFFSRAARSVMISLLAS